jgi:hypothetical protein
VLEYFSFYSSDKVGEIRVICVMHLLSFFHLDNQIL